MRFAPTIWSVTFSNKPAAALLATLVLSACGGVDDDDQLTPSTIDLATEAELRTNRDPNRLVVYSNNIENMIFDWKDLVHEMEVHPLRPDIFLVQQVSDRDELDRLIAFMSRRLGVDYDGIVAQNEPTHHRFGGQVLPRPRVTTGVIFRSSRFDVVNHHDWMPFGRGFKNGPKTCSERSNNSGYETLRVRLRDRLANEDVVVMSLRHWTWHACSSKNLAELVAGNDTEGPNRHPRLGSASALHIVGGDFNDRIFSRTGGYACWYRQMNRSVPAGNCKNVDYGFTDPLYAECNGSSECMRRRAGIDSLFVRRSDGRPARTSNFDIISYEQAHRASVRSTGGDAPSNLRNRDGYNDVAGRYSGHQARRAYVYYR